MKTKNIAKQASVAIIAILVLNVIFFSLGRIAPAIFWAVIALSAFFAYALLPRIKK